MTDKVITEAEQLLIDSIKGISEGASQTIDFAKEQIPDVIHQLLLWNMTQSIVICVILLIVICIAAVVVYKDLTEWKSEVMFILGTVTLLVSLYFFMTNLFKATKLWLAPKVWLLEYASQLLK